ncbi:MAG TPA: glycoside hydrolase domain-containing protein [Cyclobacteriaceae bacterium]
MQKTLLITLVFLYSGTGFSQFKGQIDISKAPKLKGHYKEEYALDKPTDSAKWLTQSKGMHAGFGSEDKLYFRTEVPDVQSNSKWEETGWRGERLNAQIVVWSPDTLQQVHFKVNDLKSSGGSTLAANNITMSIVHYVLSNFPYGGSPQNCSPTPYKDVFLMPDRFETIDPKTTRFDINGRTVRPVWLQLNIPEGQSPGVYTGTIDVYSMDHKATLDLKVNVQSQVLPKPHDWKFRLDLWQNPWVVAWHFDLKPWSDEHKALLKKHLKLYADAGGKYITTYAVHSPWSDNSYMIEGGMIDWIKANDGSWKFDYSIFDQYVQLCMEAGIDQAITLYTPIPWGNRFRYRDEKTGADVYESWAPGTTAFKDHWNTFLTDLRRHLDEKGWFARTYLGINENAMEQTLAAIKVIKDHSKDWRITYAGDWHKELDQLLDDYSFVHGKEPSMAEQKWRTMRGATSTFYVCCTPARPNNFLFSPPIEGRWLGWYSYAYGYDGFLRWAYDAWPADPMRDARHGSWAAGDCYLVYPGANSCIRMEKLREGISDFEKIRILRERAAHSTDKNVKKIITDFDQVLASVAKEREFKEATLIDILSKGKALVNQLSETLK